MTTYRKLDAPGLTVRTNPTPHLARGLTLVCSVCGTAVATGAQDRAAHATLHDEPVTWARKDTA